MISIRRRFISPAVGPDTVVYAGIGIPGQRARRVGRGADPGVGLRHFGITRTKPNGVDVPAMSLGQHDWDIHAV